MRLVVGAIASSLPPCWLGNRYAHAAQICSHTRSAGMCGPAEVWKHHRGLQNFRCDQLRVKNGYTNGGVLKRSQKRCTERTCRTAARSTFTANGATRASPPRTASARTGGTRGARLEAPSRRSSQQLSRGVRLCEYAESQPSIKHMHRFDFKRYIKVHGCCGSRHITDSISHSYTGYSVVYTPALTQNKMQNFTPV